MTGIGVPGRVALSFLFLITIFSLFSPQTQFLLDIHLVSNPFDVIWGGGWVAHQADHYHQIWGSGEPWPQFEW